MIEAFEDLCRKLEVPPTQANVWLIEDEFSRQLSSSQSRLSEAVKVLEETIPLLDEAADKLEAEGMWGTSERDMANRSRQFLASLGEET